MPRSSGAFTVRAGFIKDNFGDDERIGLFQSGTTGFFIENVVNLDGKIDHAAGQYALRRDLETFVDSMNISALIEWKEDFKKAFSKKYIDENWEKYSDDIGDGKTICYIRDTKK